MVRTTLVKLPYSNATMRSHTRTMNGAGYGTVLLDGGLGGQSSYHSVDDYINTTGRDLQTNKVLRSEGRGLSDKIAQRLQGLQITKEKTPKRKNITMSF